MQSKGRREEKEKSSFSFPRREEECSPITLVKYEMNKYEKFYKVNNLNERNRYIWKTEDKCLQYHEPKELENATVFCPTVFVNTVTNDLFQSV